MHTKEVFDIQTWRIFLIPSLKKINMKISRYSRSNNKPFIRARLTSPIRTS
jgi:hypothetical protein